MRAVHIEKVRYYDPVDKCYKWCETNVFDTVIHINRSKTHILQDIERLLKEDGKHKPVG